ncbi:SlyX family protein [Massilia sp. PWRC2]|uniref:SlyX family protein n=1 Tax=Massilia sp. PWRC2 TaxID=2804626 RepID=UPI003CF35A8C
MSTDERFMAIEIKLAHQEDLVDALNDVVYQQTRRIDHLESMVNALAEHMRNAAQTTPGAGAHEVPPHY